MPGRRGGPNRALGWLVCMLEFDSEFTQHLPADVEHFDYFMRLNGECFRELANRRTLRFELAGRRYFLKAHYGVGWREILKNLLQFRLPVLGARNEWRAMQRLQALKCRDHADGWIRGTRLESCASPIICDH